MFLFLNIVLLIHDFQDIMIPDEEKNNNNDVNNSESYFSDKANLW